MKKYQLGRNIVLVTTVLQILTTLSLALIYETPLLLANIFEHVLALGFFIGLILVFVGLVILKEYKDYKFSFLDVIFILLVIFTADDYWHTLIAPHPLYHDQYWI